MSPSEVALAVACVGAAGMVISSRINANTTTKTTAQAAVSKALEQVWQQRIQFRDEQIEELRADLASASEKIERLSSEVSRLTQLVVQLGGTPHE